MFLLLHSYSVGAGTYIREKYPNSIFFGGQLVFEKETLMNRILHNYTSFEIQKKLYQQGVQFVLLPIKL